MKKIFAIAAMAVACLSANAQQAVGTFSLQPKVGVVLGTTTGDGAQNRYGLTAGVEGLYQINNWFGISAGVNYSQYGAKSEEDYAKVTLKYDYITVPVLANFYVAHNLALKTGVEFAFNAKKDLSYSEGGASAQISTANTLYEPKSTLVSIPVGISYEFDAGIVLDLRYNFGVTEAFKYGDAHQMAAMFTVGYKFGL